MQHHPFRRPHPLARFTNLVSLLLTRPGLLSLALATLNTTPPALAITPDESGRHLSEYYTLTFQSDTSPTLLPLRFSPPELTKLLATGSKTPVAAAQRGTLLFDFTAADAFRVTGGYWRDYNTEPFAILYRDTPRSYELDLNSNLPAPIKDAINQAYRFEYGSEIAAGAHTLLRKLARLRNHRAPLALRHLIKIVETQPDTTNSWLNHSRGAATLAAHSSTLPPLAPAYLCEDDIILSDVEVIDLLALAYSANTPTTLYGENRGTSTDKSLPSPERYLFEELFGTRALTPETFIDLLNQNIRPGGAGLIIDEASDPRAQSMPHFEVWERAVHDFMITDTQSSVTVSELPYDLVVRYWEIVADVYADESLRATLKQGYTLSEQALLQVDNAYSAFVQAPLAQKNARLADYAAAKRRYRDTFHDQFLRHASTLWKLAHESADTRPWQVTVTTIVVRIQRDRADLYSLHQPLTTLEYSAISLGHFVHRGAPTWLSRSRAYPPDFAYIPTLTPTVAADVKGWLGYLGGKRCADVRGEARE